MTLSRWETADGVASGQGKHSGASLPLVAGLVTVLPMLGLLALTIGSNTPIGPRLPLESIRTPVETAAIAGPSLGAVLLGVTATNPVHRVALLFAGVFGALTAIASPASVPAALALLGAAVGLGGSQRSATLQRAVGVAVATAVVLGMVGLLGIEPTRMRSLASLVVAVGLAATPAFTGLNRRSVVIALIAAALVGVAGLAAPVGVAAVSLLGMGYVGLSLPLLVVAVGGATAAVVAGLETDRPVTALGATVAFLAGVPSSIPAGVTLVVGLALLRGVSR
jgi:hypothetical protein